MGPWGGRPPREAAGGGAQAEPAAGRRPSLSQFGLGFWQAWWMFAMCSEVLIPAPAAGALVQPTGVFLLLTTLGYLVPVLLGARGLAGSRGVGKRAYARDRAPSTALVATLCGCSTLGLAACAHVESPGASWLWWASFVACGCVLSVGNALLLVGWGRRWSLLASGHVGRYVYMSYIVGIAVLLLSSPLPLALRAVIASACPVVSCAILARSASEPRRDPPRVDYEQVRPPLARPIAFTFVLNLVWGLSLPCLTTLAGSRLPGAGALALAAALLALLIAYLSVANPEAETFSLMAPTGICLASGPILCVLLPEGMSFVGYGVSTLGGACLDMLVMIVASDMSARLGGSVAVTLGGAMAISRAGSLAGRACFDLLPALDRQSAAGVALACVIVVIVCCLGVFDRARLEALYRVAPPPPREDTLDDRCDRLAASAGLTAREREIVSLLARGRSAPFIAERLSLSVGTVKNYTSTIYRKVGVGDRQGLLNVIEASNAFTCDDDR